MSKKISIMLIVLTLIVSMFALVACSNEKKDADNGNINVSKVGDLLSDDFSVSTKAFLSAVVNRVAKSDLESGKTFDAANIVEASCDIGDTEATTLASVSVIYIYKNGENRDYIVDNVKFSEGLDLNKIAKYSNKKKALDTAIASATIENKFKESYNASGNKQYAMLAKALYSNVIEKETDGTHLTIAFDPNGKIEDMFDGYIQDAKSFIVYAEDKSGFTKYNLTVKYEDSVEQMYNNIRILGKQYGKSDKETKVCDFTSLVEVIKYADTLNDEEAGSTPIANMG